jgi:membrane-bound lytic murein transglycosylase C
MKTQVKGHVLIWIVTAIVLVSGCVSAPRTLEAPLRADPYGAGEALLARKKWDTVAVSTSMRWVDYYAEAESRSEVRFDRGTVTFEAIVALEEGGPGREAKEKVVQSVRRAFAARAADGFGLLEDQVTTPDGETVDEANVEGYIETVVLPTLTIRARYTAPDGERRVRVASTVKMTPAHAKIRAAHYQETVHREAARFGIDPALIMAIIHTESYFNPFARSPDGALGLMQLIPRFAGKEAYAWIYKEHKTPSDEYLYNPQKNIELGTAYFHLLLRRYFNDIKAAEKRLYLAICAYNWGPTIIRREIADRHGVDDLPLSDLYALLKAKTPLETRTFLSDVLTRLEGYRRLLETAG